MQDYRVDERERQRAYRARMASAKLDRHAPASTLKHPDVLEKMLESWDKAMALSRASLRRRFVVIWRQSVTAVETARDEAERLSRASLGP